jgi:hypothetical protein
MDRKTMKPVGGVVYGVYFQEVVPSLGLSFKLVNEVKLLGCAVTGDGHSDLRILKNDFKTLLLHDLGFTRKSQTYKEILSMYDSFLLLCLSLSLCLSHLSFISLSHLSLIQN